MSVQVGDATRLEALRYHHECLYPETKQLQEHGNESHQDIECNSAGHPVDDMRQLEGLQTERHIANQGEEMMPNLDASLLSVEQLN